MSRNVGIVYIRVLYACDEESIWGVRAGGTGGFKHDKVKEFPAYFGLESMQLRLSVVTFSFISFLLYDGFAGYLGPSI